MMRMVLSACTLLALCGCRAEKRQDVLETRLQELESLFRYIDTREERNSYRHDIELLEIRRHVGITNDLTFVAENGGGGPSPEFELSLEMIEDISRALDRACHHLDALSNRLDRLEQRPAGGTNEVTVIVIP